MIKKILSLMLAISMLASLAMATASAEVGNDADGEYYTYYVIAPENWFSTNDSIGMYYWVPEKNGEWPGEEVKPENCVYEFEDGRKIFKVQIWQEDADTQDECLTTPIVLFNSYVDVALDPENGHQTDNINLEGYEASEIATLKYGNDTTEFPRYKEGFETLNFNNMIYVPNLELEVENEFSGASAIGGGVWYYYWGDGEYGTTKTKPAPTPDSSQLKVDPYDLGDVSGDGSIAMTDVVDMQRAIANLKSLSDDAKKAADVNADEKVTMEDVVLVQKYIALLISKF